MKDFNDGMCNHCEQSIRADERKRFAIWLDTHGFMRKMDLNISRVDEASYEYEKEKKND